MATITIYRTWEVDGVMTDPTSVVLRDESGTYGVKRADSGETVVAAGSAFTKVSTGYYEYEVTGLIAGVTYVAATEVVFLGRTLRFETTHVARPDTAIISASEVLAELGIASPTSIETAIVNNAIIKAHGAVRRALGYDPVRAERTEYHPQMPFQAQISRGIWEVMEQRAVLRQVSESATNELQLQHLPVRSVAEVRVDYNGRSGTASGSFGTSTIRVQGVSYWPNFDCLDSSGNAVCRDGVLRTLGLWPTTPGTVKVKYTAGYTAAELRGGDPILNAEPIWEACLDEAVRRARRVLAMAKGSAGVPASLMQSENLGDYSYSADVGSLARLFDGDLAHENAARLMDFVNLGFAIGA